MTDPVQPGLTRHGMRLRILRALLVMTWVGLLLFFSWWIGSEILAGQGFRAGSGRAGSPLFGPVTTLSEITNQKVNP